MQGEREGVVPFVVLAVAAAGLVPLRASLPALTFTRVSLGFIIVACAAIIVALAVGGLSVAFLVFFLIVLAFSSGVYTGRNRDST